MQPRSPAPTGASQCATGTNGQFLDASGKCFIYNRFWRESTFFVAYVAPGGSHHRVTVNATTPVNVSGAPHEKRFARGVLR